MPTRIEKDPLAAALTGLGHADVNLIFIPDAVFGDQVDWFEQQI